MEGKQESVVEVSLAAQGAVVDVGLLLVVFVSVEPAESRHETHEVMLVLLFEFIGEITDVFVIDWRAPPTL